MPAPILLGTCGYDYPEWRGTFYPATLKREDFLTYYAATFNALELNFTFYQMPDDIRLRHFADRTGSTLLYSVKANRLLTHDAGRGWKEAAAAFQAACLPLRVQGVLAAVLFQFPQSFHYTPENRLYLAELLRTFRGFPSVVEFRHRAWIRQSVFQGLADFGASLAFCDLPQISALPEHTPFVGNIAYLRMHGRNAGAWYAHDGANRNARYEYAYSPDELREFVPIITAAAHSDRTVQVYFNNHPKGDGATNAAQLAAMLANQSPSSEV